MIRNLKGIVLVFCWSLALTAAPDIYRKPAQTRTKRPGQLKEEIAQLCITTLEYTTELIDQQAQLQIAVTAGVPAEKISGVVRTLTSMQRALYKRIRELAQSDEQAYLQRASARELQASLKKIDGVVDELKKGFIMLERLTSQLTDKKCDLVQKRTEIGKAQTALLEQLVEAQKFFENGCRAV